MALAQHPDKTELIKEIANHLQRLSLLYQVNNWGIENSVVLAGWIYDNYKGYRINDVIECLKNPPSTEGKQWRLTPDTINEWMEVQIGKVEPIQSIEPEKTEPEKPYEPMPDVDKLLNDFANSLRDSKIQGMPSLTKQEIKQEGKSEPPRKKAAASAQFLTSPEQARLKELKTEWMRKFTDLYTGKVKEGAPSFEEYTKQK